MLAILLMMLLIVLVAVAVVLYVAYPHRGADVPKLPWVGRAMRKGVSAMPVIKDEAETRR